MVGSEPGAPDPLRAVLGTVPCVAHSIRRAVLLSQLDRTVSGRPKWSRR